jgi:REP element-mobilizing transposase RayT
VAHRARPVHYHGHPVHVTMRVERRVPDLRHPCLFFVTRDAVVAGTRAGFRVVHYSVQRDHLHLLVEAGDKTALAHGLRALAIRVAKTVNAACGTTGRVLEGRYHARALRTPREVRFGLLYVLMNHKKHLRGSVRTLIDRCSSGIWFRGWRETGPLRNDSALASPETWLLRSGWSEHGGKLSVHAAPRPP